LMWMIHYFMCNVIFFFIHIVLFSNKHLTLELYQNMTTIGKQLNCRRYRFLQLCFLHHILKLGTVPIGFVARVPQSVLKYNYQLS